MCFRHVLRIFLTPTLYSYLKIIQTPSTANNSRHGYIRIHSVENIIVHMKGDTMEIPQSCWRKAVARGAGSHSWGRCRNRRGCHRGGGGWYHNARDMHTCITSCAPSAPRAKVRLDVVHATCYFVSPCSATALPLFAWRGPPLPRAAHRRSLCAHYEKNLDLF